LTHLPALRLCLLQLLLQPLMPHTTHLPIAHLLLQWLWLQLHVQHPTEWQHQLLPLVLCMMTWMGCLAQLPQPPALAALGPPALAALGPLRPGTTTLLRHPQFKAQPCKNHSTTCLLLSQCLSQPPPRPRLLPLGEMTLAPSLQALRPQSHPHPAPPPPRATLTGLSLSMALRSLERAIALQQSRLPLVAAPRCARLARPCRS
jgi:hypothetical protein